MTINSSLLLNILTRVDLPTNPLTHKMHKNNAIKPSFVMKLLSFLSIVAVLAPSNVTAWAPPSKATSQIFVVTNRKETKASIAPSWNAILGSSVMAASLFVGVANPASAAVVGKGELIFEANCAQCHAAGKQLGVKKMSLQKDALLKGPGLSQVEIENYLKEESPHKYMPLKLKAQGYTQVVSYVLDNALNDKWGE